MKSPRILPAVLVCLVTFSPLGGTLLRAADDDQATHQAAAEKVLDAMHMDALILSTSDHIMSGVDKMIDSTAQQIGNKPDAADFQTRMHAETREMLKKQFNWDALKPDFVKDYEDTFTTPELKELAAFYESPVGQKLGNKQPEISERIDKATRARMTQVVPAVINLVRSESAKLGVAGPSAPRSPGGFPVPPPAPGTLRPPMPLSPPMPFAPPPPPPAVAPLLPATTPMASPDAATSSPSSIPAVNPEPKSRP